MPLYVYRCDPCRSAAAALADPNDAGVVSLARPVAERDAPVVCPCCGGPLRRLLSPPAVKIR